MSDKIIKRHDTSSNWVSSNPILEIAEEGYATDVKNSKVGDGITRWNDLQYINDNGNLRREIISVQFSLDDPNDFVNVEVYGTFPKDYDFNRFATIVNSDGTTIRYNALIIIKELFDALPVLDSDDFLNIACDFADAGVIRVGNCSLNREILGSSIQIRITDNHRLVTAQFNNSSTSFYSIEFLYGGKIGQLYTENRCSLANASDYVSINAETKRVELKVSANDMIVTRSINCPTRKVTMDRGSMPDYINKAISVSVVRKVEPSTMDGFGYYLCFGYLGDITIETVWQDFCSSQSLIEFYK